MEQKKWYIQYLLDLLQNPTKFQLNGYERAIFQLKLYDITVTLKYGQGHWKWYEQATLNE